MMGSTEGHNVRFGIMPASFSRDNVVCINRRPPTDEARSFSDLFEEFRIFFPDGFGECESVIVHLCFDWGAYSPSMSAD